MGGKHLAPPQEHTRRSIILGGGALVGLGAVVVATGELPKILDGHDEATTVDLVTAPELDPPARTPVFEEIASEFEGQEFDEILTGHKLDAPTQSRRAALERERAQTRARAARTARREPVKPKRKATLQSTRPGTVPIKAGTAAAVIATSRKYFGTPYRWGGKTAAGGLDCSGYTRLVYMQHGVRLPHGSRYQAKVGVRVSDPKPGDLIFVKNALGVVHHVGIYVGEGYMHDAPRTGLTVGRRRVWSKPSRTFYRRVLG